MQVDGPLRKKGQAEHDMDGSSKELRIDLKKCNLFEDLTPNRLEW